MLAHYSGNSLVLVHFRREKFTANLGVQNGSFILKILDEWITSGDMPASKLYVSIIEKAGKSVCSHESISRSSIMT